MAKKQPARANKPSKKKPAPTKPPARSQPAPPAEGVPPPKLSALAAAARVLAETDQSLTCPELIAAMASKGSWTSPKGRTPAATLHAALVREIQTKGEAARFRKTDRGKFALVVAP